MTIPASGCYLVHERGESSDAGLADGAAPPACTEAPWILFSYMGGSPAADIYAMHADGTELHRLAFPDARIFEPSVSADGLFIGYVLLGGPLTPQTIAIYDTRAGTTQHLTLGTGISHPAFSPDASLISYANGLDLHVVHRDGSGDRTLITGPYDAGCCGWGYGHPVFESASTILWTSAGLTGAIHTDGTGMMPLLSSELWFASPTLSPDGTRLATLISCAGTGTNALRIYSLASLPADCTTGHIIADGLAENADVGNTPNPSWGPTDMIAFGQMNDVFVIDASGGTPRNLTASLTAAGGAAGDPAWAPGCTRLP